MRDFSSSSATVQGAKRFIAALSHTGVLVSITFAFTIYMPKGENIVLVNNNNNVVSCRLNETWGLRRKEVGLLPAGIWSVGRAAAGCSLTALDAPTPGRR